MSPESDEPKDGWDVCIHGRSLQLIFVVSVLSIRAQVGYSRQSYERTRFQLRIFPHVHSL
jgi:hypothetical protein